MMCERRLSLESHDKSPSQAWGRLVGRWHQCATPHLASVEDPQGRAHGYQ
jgi:hypothetical protein